MHRLSSMPAARRRVWRFKVICASVSDFSLCLAVFSDARDQKAWTLREGPLHGPCGLSVLDHGGRRADFATVGVFPRPYRLGGFP